jgi:hypothetical protein
MNRNSYSTGTNFLVALGIRDLVLEGSEEQLDACAARGRVDISIIEDGLTGASANAWPMLGCQVHSPAATRNRKPQKAKQLPYLIDLALGWLRLESLREL